MEAALVLGTNDITPVAGGCGLREPWRGARGGAAVDPITWTPLASGEVRQQWYR